MSLHLNFEPHSWYMGFAIRDCRDEIIEDDQSVAGVWNGITDDGMTYRIIDLEAKTLKRLKSKIRRYHLRKHDGYGERIARRRLEQLRLALHAENISYGELAELQGLASYISDGDVELLEAAGVPEGSR